MDVLSITLGVSTALSGGGAVFLWLETHTQGGRTRRENRLHDQITAQLSEVLKPVTDELQGMKAVLDRRPTEVNLAIREALEPLKDQLATLNTKVEPLWAVLINMGINQINVLHQPDPARAEIDGLLEELHAELEGGPLMPADHYLKMRHFLNLIKTWEPGKELGFPVLPSEPTSAGILLSIMGLSRERRRQERR